MEPLRLRRDRLPEDWRSLSEDEAQEVLSRYVKMRAILPSEARYMYGLPPIEDIDEYPPNSPELTALLVAGRFLARHVVKELRTFNLGDGRPIESPLTTMWQAIAAACDDMLVGPSETGVSDE